MKKSLHLVLSFVVLVVASGCATVEPYDYSAFLEHKPQSILVLPPLNNSVDVNAIPIYLSTVTQPLAERGFYIFPVEVVNQLMLENGLASSAEMHEIPMAKLKEIINPDSVMYITINDWGTKYAVLASVTVVDINAKLIDANTEALLWNGSARVQYDPNQNNQAGLLGAVVGAVVGQILSKKFDHSPNVARMANSQLFYAPSIGLPPGPYMPVVAETTDASGSN